MIRMAVRAWMMWALLPAVVMLVPALAQAQPVGAGPMTGALTDTEPQTGVLSFARIKFAPGLVIREIGWDSNVFDEADNPKEDYVAAVMPDISAFTLLRFLQVSAYAGTDLNYYRTYSNENSVGYAARGRVDFLLSRVRPFFGAGHTSARLRPNGEIDTRADRGERELSAGAAFVLSEFSSVYGSASLYEQEFRDAFEEGVNLSLALNRETHQYSAGFRTALTPLLTMTVSGGYGEDIFRAVPLRNSESWSATMSLRAGAEAVITGFGNLTFRDFKPDDPEVERFRGVTGQMGMTYSFLELGRFGLSGSRTIEYSFDESEGYFVENTVNLSYTHRLFDKVDAQVRGSKSWFDYGHRTTTPPRVDTLDATGASVGYNFPNRTRLGLYYEFSRRRSPALPERNYDRQRAYLAWSFVAP